VPSPQRPERRRSQADRTRTTRNALTAAGRDLFGRLGYADVSAEQITARAGLTRGALYHHFKGKEGLFTQVFDDLEAEIAAELTAAVEGIDDLPAVITVALATMLQIADRPETVRIALTDAPAVLGWAHWREIEAKHGLGLVRDLLRQAGERGQLKEAPHHVLAQLVLSAVTEAVLVIAAADDRARARAQAQQSLLILLSGLLVEDPR
jgi:AcrR family transcriptional regulator